MRFQKQLYRHDPENDVHGDCHRTAIACVLDLPPEAVPNYFGDTTLTPNEAHERYEFWLNERDFNTITMVFDTPDYRDVLNTIAMTNRFRPGLIYLLGGESGSGCGHTVVCRDDEIIWDPSQVNSGIVGPMSDGYYWLTFFGTTQAVAPNMTDMEMAA